MQVIFDLDGTLIDTALPTACAFARLCAAHGLPPLPLQTIKAMIGVANPEFYLQLYPHAPQEQVLRFGAAVELLEAEIMQELGPSLLLPGVRELLLRLQADNIQLCIASTGDTLHVTTALTCTHLLPFFAKVRCHSPEKTQMLHDLLISDPGPSYMVGDAEKDWQCAKNNHIPSIAACFGYCSTAMARHFDYIADTPLDVLRILQTPL